MMIIQFSTNIPIRQCHNWHRNEYIPGTNWIQSSSSLEHPSTSRNPIEWVGGGFFRVVQFNVVTIQFLPLPVTGDGKGGVERNYLHSDLHFHWKLISKSFSTLVGPVIGTTTHPMQLDGSLSVPNRTPATRDTECDLCELWLILTALSASSSLLLQGRTDRA